MLCLCYEKHCTRNTSDAGSGLNDLKRGTKHIARGVSGTGKLPIGSAGFYYHAAEIERVFNEFACAFKGETFLFAYFGKLYGIFFSHRIIERVNNLCFRNVTKTVFLGKFKDFRGITDENYVCHTVGNGAVGCTHGSFFRSFGQYYALGIFFSAFYEFANYIHYVISDLYVIRFAKLAIFIQRQGFCASHYRQILPYL